LCRYTGDAALAAVDAASEELEREEAADEVAVGADVSRRTSVATTVFESADDGAATFDAAWAGGCLQSSTL
jgi:hypothetical protein